MGEVRKVSGKCFQEVPSSINIRMSPLVFLLFARNRKLFNRDSKKEGKPENFTKRCDER